MVSIKFLFINNEYFHKISFLYIIHVFIFYSQHYLHYLPKRTNFLFLASIIFYFLKDKFLIFKSVCWSKCLTAIYYWFVWYYLIFISIIQWFLYLNFTFNFFFVVAGDLNPGPCIYYALSLPTELSLRIFITSVWYYLKKLQSIFQKKNYNQNKLNFLYRIGKTEY